MEAQPKFTKRRLKAHDNLIVQVIMRQAGSLDKAMLEGVMNSADAGATQVGITLTDRKLTIDDDGEGITSQKEIDDFFETFGTPHTAEEDAKGNRYGFFRMGRGQIFSFGKNRWRTNQFVMDVDIKGEGLDYGLAVVEKPVKGCHIEVDLYSPLIPSDMHRILASIERMAKYLPIEFKLNGKVVSIDATKEKWDYVTDEAYVRIRETTSLGVYNLGVLVRDFGNHEFGCGGVVVSRQQLKLNFARNDVMSDCPVWKAVKKVVNQKATEKNKRKPVLDDGERQRLADQIVSGEIEREDAKELKVFTDVTGKQWSAEQIERSKVGSRVTVAEKGNMCGDKLMQGGTCFVFAQDTLERFNMTLPKLIALISNLVRHYNPKVLSFAEATKGMDSKHILLDKKEWSCREQVFVRLLERCTDNVLRGTVPDGRLAGNWDAFHEAMKKNRTILIGSSKSASAWTDGRSYIVFAREYLSGIQTNMRGLLDLFDTLLHEYCHESSDAGSHIHALEFYQKFHDARRGSINGAICAFGLLPEIMDQLGKKLNTITLKQQDALAKMKLANDRNAKLVGEVPAEPVQIAAKAVATYTNPPKAEEPKAPKPPKPVVSVPEGECPYRVTSNYGKLFLLGNSKFWTRAELLTAGAKVTGKEESLVSNDLAVLINSNHRSNGQKSKVERNDNGQIRIVKA